MASVRNIDEAPSPDSSNTVLFEMMMFYKQQAELAEKERAQAEARYEGLEVEYNELRNYTSDLQGEHHDRLLDLHAFEIANRRGAEIITRKHEAGMLMLDAFDSLVGAILLARQAELNTESPNDNVAFVYEQAGEARERIDVASTMFMTGWMRPGVDVDMTTQEEVDLTGEETETDEEMEF